MTISIPVNTCPSWCTVTAPHTQDHWRDGAYVAASRTRPADIGMDGATVPAIAGHLAKTCAESTTDVVLHIGGAERDEDFEVRLSPDDAIAHLAHLADTLVALFGGKGRRSYGGDARDIALFDTSARVIVDAYLSESQQAKPIVYDEAQAVKDVQAMTAQVSEIRVQHPAPNRPGFFATKEQKNAYERAALEVELPTSPTYGVVTWIVANGPNKGQTQAAFGTWAKAVERGSDDPLARPTLLRCSRTGQDVSIASIQSWTKAMVVPMAAIEEVLLAVPDEAGPGGKAVTALNNASLDLSSNFLHAEEGRQP